MPIQRMTAEQAREHLARLEISQQAFSRLIRVNPTTVRRWLMVEANPPNEIPRAVEILLPLLTPALVKKLIAQDS